MRVDQLRNNKTLTYKRKKRKEKNKITGVLLSDEKSDVHTYTQYAHVQIRGKDTQRHGYTRTNTYIHTVCLEFSSDL